MLGEAADLLVDDCGVGEEELWEELEWRWKERDGEWA